MMRMIVDDCVSIV